MSRDIWGCHDRVCVSGDGECVGISGVESGWSFISSSLTPNVPSAGLRCSVAQEGAGSNRPLQVIWAGAQP